jgi:hypothetical protein
VYVMINKTDEKRTSVNMLYTVTATVARVGWEN